MSSGYRRPSTVTYISSGWQDHKNRKPRPSIEPGVDYGTPYGTPLYAPAAGRVSLIKRDASGASGRRLSIAFDDGRMVSMIHLKDDFRVKVGDRVSAGQLVGFSGASANGLEWGIGAHVHVTLFPTHEHIYQTNHTLNFEAHIGGGTTGRGGYADGSAELRRSQQKLIRMGHNLGPTGADAKFGPRTRAATLHEQKSSVTNRYPGGKLTPDGLPGPSTEAYLDWWLVGRHQTVRRATVADLASLKNTRGLQKVAKLYGYTGPLDNIFGQGSRTGLQKFLDRNYAGSLPQWLRVKYGYVGNDAWGPVMAAAAARADTANWNAL